MRLLRRPSFWLSVTFFVFAAVAILELTGLSKDLRDIFKANAYAETEPAEITALASELSLTDKGLRTFRAVRPSLENAESFNANCSAHNPEVYVLGCYDPHKDQFFLYNTNGLDGIVESTAAHELLHAVWRRLPVWTKFSLSQELAHFYQSLPDDAEVKNSMSLYTDEEFYDELHSRIGTEVSDLPASLLDHYGHYFSDQPRIVAYYASYSDTYKSILNELSTLKDELDEDNAEIASDTDHYNSWYEELEHKIVDFNANVNDYTAAEYKSNRQRLQSEIDQFNTYFNNLNHKVELYNQKVAQYNQKAEEQRFILKSINSNADTVIQPSTAPATLKDPSITLNNQ